MLGFTNIQEEDPSSSSSSIDDNIVVVVVVVDVVVVIVANAIHDAMTAKKRRLAVRNVVVVVVIVTKKKRISFFIFYTKVSLLDVCPFSFFVFCFFRVCVSCWGDDDLFSSSRDEECTRLERENSLSCQPPKRAPNRLTPSFRDEEHDDDISHNLSVAHRGFATKRWTKLQLISFRVYVQMVSKMCRKVNDQYPKIFVGIVNQQVLFYEEAM